MRDENDEGRDRAKQDDKGDGYQFQELGNRGHRFGICPRCIEIRTHRWGSQFRHSSVHQPTRRFDAVSSGPRLKCLEMHYLTHGLSVQAACRGFSVNFASLAQRADRLTCQFRIIE